MRNGAHAGIRPLQALVPGRAGDHDGPTRGLGSRRAVERDVRRCDPASGPRATHDDAQGPWVGHQAEPRGPGRGATAGRRAPEPRAEAQAAASGQGCAARQGRDSTIVEIEEIEDLPMPAPTCAALGDEGQARVMWIADTGSANHLCAENTMPGNVFDDIKPCQRAPGHGERGHRATGAARGPLAEPWRGRSVPRVEGLSARTERRAASGGARLPIPLDKESGMVRYAWRTSSSMPGEELRAPHRHRPVTYVDERCCFCVSEVVVARSCTTRPRDSRWSASR